MDTVIYPNDKTNNLRYIAYLRKSTEDAERQAMSIPAQMDAIKNMFPDLKIAFIKGDPDEKGNDSHGEQRSAFTPGRPYFNKMLRDLEEDKLDGIIAWHPDRLSRNEIDAAAITYGVRTGVIKDLKFCSYYFDKSPEGISMLQNTMVQSQYSSAKLSKDVKRGMSAKRKGGGINGVAPPGYLNGDKPGTIVKDPIRFPLIRKAWDLMLTDDYTVTQILRVLNDNLGYTSVKHRRIGGKPMSRNVLDRIFRNIRYAGFIARAAYDGPGEPFKTDQYEPMVTLEEFNRVQKILAKNSTPRRLETKKEFLLRGLLVCGECGCAITAEETPKKLKNGTVNIHRYYHCTYRRRGYYCKQRKNIREDDLYQQVEELLSRYELTPELADWGRRALDELSKKEIDDRNGAQAMQFTTIKETQDQLDRLLNMATLGYITAEQYRDKKEGLEQRLEQLTEEQAATMERVKNWYEIVGNTLTQLENASTAFAEGDINDKKRILVAIGQNPKLTDGKVTIDEYYWLRPVVENKQKLTEEAETVRTGNQQIQKDATQAVMSTWQAVLTEVRTLIQQIS